MPSFDMTSLPCSTVISNGYFDFLAAPPRPASAPTQTATAQAETILTTGSTSFVKYMNYITMSGMNLIGDKWFLFVKDTADNLMKFYLYCFETTRMPAVSITLPAGWYLITSGAPSPATAPQNMRLNNASTVVGDAANTELDTRACALYADRIFTEPAIALLRDGYDYWLASAVTGLHTITMKATAPGYPDSLAGTGASFCVYAVSVSLSGCEPYTGAPGIPGGVAFSYAFAASQGYTLAGSTPYVTIGGASYGQYIFNRTTGVLTIPASAVTGNIAVTLSAIAE